MSQIDPKDLQVLIRRTWRRLGGMRKLAADLNHRAKVSQFLRLCVSERRAK